MSNFDPRVTPARPDLAAKHLEGKVKSARFVEGQLRDVIVPQAPLRRTPSPDAPLDTEALKGERVVVYEENDEGWCWGQLESDGYVGWIPARALGPAGKSPTHRVSALRTLTFPGPSIKLPPVDSPPLGSKLHVARFEQEFAVSSDGGYLPRRHVKLVSELENDFVEVAQRFVGTPYLWGGKTSAGIDCSGLVQIALTAAGLKCPRDSDMQEQSLGKSVASQDISGVQRGDLVFWPGHVAIACNTNHVVHANAFHMAVALEPISEAVARIAASGGVVRSIRRLDGLARAGATG
ncbi:MAG: C40 family peptidase [Xanthobacteraceae bacterium]